MRANGSCAPSSVQLRWFDGCLVPTSKTQAMTHAETSARSQRRLRGTFPDREGMDQGRFAWPFVASVGGRRSARLESWNTLNTDHTDLNGSNHAHSNVSAIDTIRNNPSNPCSNL